MKSEMNATGGLDGGPPPNNTDLEPTAWSLSAFSLYSFASCLILIVTLGVIGNFLVIYVSIVNSLRRGPSTTIDVYIFNLSIADFLYLLFCVPFQGTVFILNDWPYGLALCKIAYFCQSVTASASIWLLTIMSVDRFVAIAHPLKSVKLRTVERATKISATVWLVSLIWSLPSLALFTTVDYPESTICVDMWPLGMVEYRKWSTLLVLFMTFLLPTFVIFSMALLICFAIRSSVHHSLLRTESQGRDDGASPHTRRRRRVIWLVFALALVQLVCWCPYSVTVVWLNFDTKAWEWVEDNSWTYFVTNILNHMGTYLHSCINPVVYSLASGQFRIKLVQAFRRGRRSPNGSMTVTCYFGPGSPLTQTMIASAVRR